MADQSISVTRKKVGRPATGEARGVTTRLPDKLLARLDALAERLGIERSTLVREYIERGVKRDERNR